MNDSPSKAICGTARPGPAAATAAQSTDAGLQCWEQERQQKLGRLERKDATRAAEVSSQVRGIVTSQRSDREHGTTNAALRCPRLSPQLG